MADKEIKVHRRVIQMIFPMSQMSNNDRSVQSACLFYNNAAKVNKIADLPDNAVLHVP